MGHAWIQVTPEQKAPVHFGNSLTHFISSSAGGSEDMLVVSIRFFRTRPHETATDE
jgi:hypothetical protein